MPTVNPSRRLARAASAWRFLRTEQRAVRDRRSLVGIRRALIERIKLNLELDGIDSATVSDLAARLDSTRGEYAAALAEKEREIAAVRQTLADSGRLTEAIAAHIELPSEPAGAHAASPAMLGRLLALESWLDAQPPSQLTVSVIIPTCNRPALLREAIASVRAQSHEHWELIVVDDASQDTRTTLAAIDDDRVRCLRTDGLGSAGARNAGLELATGDVIAYLDDDNVMLRGWLAGVAWAFSRFEDVDVVYGARVIEDETPIGSDARLPRLAFDPFSRNRLLEGNYIDASVIAHRAKLAEARWDPELSGIADWDMMIRLTEHKPALALPVTAALYRTGAPERQSHTAAAHAAHQKLRARLDRSRG